VWALLLLTVVVSGFLICNYDLQYFYKIHRYQGQYLYFQSALLGFNCLLIFSIVVFIIHNVFPSAIHLVQSFLDFSNLEELKSSGFDDSKFDVIAYGWFICISLGTILTAWIWCLWKRAWLFLKAGNLDNAKIILMSQLLSDSPMDKLLFDSYINCDPVMLTLESRKVYVGIVTSLGEPNESYGMDQEISLLPILSGYREKDTLEVKFVTHYDKVNEDLLIVIKQDQLLALCWFDLGIYEKLNTSEK